MLHTHIYVMNTTLWFPFPINLNSVKLLSGCSRFLSAWVNEWLEELKNKARLHLCKVELFHCFNVFQIIAEARVAERAVARLRRYEAQRIRVRHKG